MSLHKSLKSRNALSRTRSVLTRNERLLQLEKEGKRTPEDSVYGLPKVRVTGGLQKKKKKKKKEEEETTTE